MDSENSEITKLTERIAKDPKSKLFVPLAEEYKKIGDIEMSIHVLTEGLKKNPGYITARSFLGRLLMEQDNLAEAQKEFEEVIKAIPDNLLAQKKLGDIYALQGRTKDAIDRYKAVVVLSPKDQETLSLIADLEAGRSVMERISKTKAKPANQPVLDRESVQKAPQGISAKPALKPVSAKPAITTPAPAAPPAPAQEAAEEVIVFELLNPEPAPAQEPAGQEVRKDAFDFLQEAAPDAGGERIPGLEVALPGGLFEEDPGVLAEPQLGGETAEASPLPPADRENALPPESLKKADDFTTDTLAELYISQGFYEKAIDIYDRMLAENPGHQGLMDKLKRLRELAGESAPAEMAKREARPEPESEALELKTEVGREYVPPPAESFPVQEAPFPGVDREAREYVPPLSPENREEPAPFGGFDLTEREPAAVDAQGGEIAEFIPHPQDDVRPAKPAGRGLDEADVAPSPPERHRVPAGQQTSPGGTGKGRTEAIGRLEQWLKNIAKEK